MPRKRIELPQEVDEQIVSMLRSGTEPDSILETLRNAGILHISRATLFRRVKEFRESGLVMRTQKKAKEAKAKPAAAPPALPDSPESIPKDATLEDVEKWIDIASRRGRLAEADGNIDAMAKMGRLYTSLLQQRERMRPKKVDDPNDNPDYIAMGARVAEELKRLIRVAARGSTTA